ncbi:hypothetical protein Hanom_Chr08g00745511 [Helianthus anomalus]
MSKTKHGCTKRGCLSHTLSVKRWRPQPKRLKVLMWCFMHFSIKIRRLALEIKKIATFGRPIL